VVAAGPLANLLLAVLLYACVQWVGQLQPSAVLGHPLPGSFAEQADLRSGDRILGVKALGLDTQYQSTATFREFINSLINAKAYFQSEQPSAQELGATNSPVLLPQMVEIAIKRGETFNADTQQDELADGLDKTSSLEDIMNMSPTQTLTIDLSRWRVSEHFQSAPQERVQALKELGLTGPRRAPVVSSVLEGGVAQKAGVLAGDEILKINGQSVADAQELVQIIHKSAAASQLQSQTGQSAVLNWQIKRKSASKETLVNLELKPRTVQEDGKSIGRVDAIIGGSQELVFKRLGFWDGLVFASRLTLDQAMTSLVSFKSMVLGQLSWHELSGPLTLAEYAGKTAQGGWASFVSFVAFVSVNVGVLNLLPIPVLDGGQLMYYLWELFTGSAPSEAWSSRLMRFGLGVVLLMMCAAMFNDVLRLIG
jgi:regulator of sigma E protease